MAYSIAAVRETSTLCSGVFLLLELGWETTWIAGRLSRHFRSKYLHKMTISYGGATAISTQHWFAGRRAARSRVSNPAFQSTPQLHTAAGTPFPPTLLSHSPRRCLRRVRRQRAGSPHSPAPPTLPHTRSASAAVLSPFSVRVFLSARPARSEAERSQAALGSTAALFHYSSEQILQSLSTSPAPPLSLNDPAQKMSETIQSSLCLVASSLLLEAVLCSLAVSPLAAPLRAEP